MTDLPNLPVAQLKLVISDARELAKGMAIADKGGIKHLARHANKLYAEADGSGSTPYKAQIVHDEKGYRGRCSCMAARSRPFCKHAAALLVAWARDPAGFALAEIAPAPAAAEGTAGKRAKPKSGKIDAHALMRQGVEQTLNLVRELALSGISTISAERVEQIRALAETLRAERLRRISARLLELAQALDVAVADYAMLDTETYAETLADIWLSARRVTRHLDGEVLQPEYVETLIGKTWTKKDRSPVAALDLIEYAYTHEITADDYSIRESRFVDLGSGRHYSEKQILPAFLAKRTAPKPSYAGFVLRGAGGGCYPGFAPIRLDLADSGTIDSPSAADFARLQAMALPDVATALGALLDARKDVFGADTVPVTIRLNALYAEGARLFAVDANGDSLLVGGGPDTAQALTQALNQAELKALLGEMLLIGAMPCLQPMALLIERDGQQRLLPLPTPDSVQLLRQRKHRASAPGKRERWIDSARELGVNAAALLLGELREELADTLSEGLSALNPRRADGMISRLQSLNLVKPAALLAEVAGRADPAEKLEDVIRLLQVLGIGLTRLAASKKVDRANLVRSPLHPAIEVQRPEVQLTPEQLLTELGSGRLQGHSRAIAIDHALATYDSATLAHLAPTLFADGSVSQLLARRYASHPELALELAQQVLGARGEHVRRWTAEADYAGQARIAKLSAILLLQTVGSAAARELLCRFRDQRRPDPALKALVNQSLDGRAPAIDPAWLAELNAANREDRIAALRRIGQHGALAAVDPVRVLAAGDPSAAVRHQAWATLALLLDVAAVPMLIAHLQNRANDEDSAREAAHALGLLGDSRAIGPLLAAFAASFKPAVIADCLRAMGPPVLPALIDCIDAQPELAERKVAQDLVIGLGAELSRDLLIARLQATPATELGARTQRYLKLASGLPQLKTWIADAAEACLTTSGEAMPADLKRILTRARAQPKVKKP